MAVCPAHGGGHRPDNCVETCSQPSDNDEEVVQVWYGEDQNIGINDRGEFTFVDTDVVPIGLLMFPRKLPGDTRRR